VSAAQKATIIKKIYKTVDTYKNGE